MRHHSAPIPRSGLDFGTIAEALNHRPLVEALILRNDTVCIIPGALTQLIQLLQSIGLIESSQFDAVVVLSYRSSDENARNLPTHGGAAAQARLPSVRVCEHPLQRNRAALRCGAAAASGVP